MPKVRFAHVGVEVDADEGQSLLEIGQKNGVAIPTVCGGVATCHECIVRVVDGADHLTPINQAEKSHLGTMFNLTRERLACQARVYGDVVIELPVRELRRAKAVAWRPRRAVKCGDSQ